MNVDHVGREVTETALGQSWTFSRWDRAIHQAYSQWAREVLPDPIEGLSRSLDKIALKDAAVLRQLQIDDLADEAKAKASGRNSIPMAPQYRPFADVLVDRAAEKLGTYLGFGSPEVNGLVASPEGMSYLLYLLLKPKHPDVTPDIAYQVMADLNRRFPANPKTGFKGRTREIIDAVSGVLEPAAKNDVAPAALIPAAGTTPDASLPTGAA